MKEQESQNKGTKTKQNKTKNLKAANGASKKLNKQEMEQFTQCSYFT